MLESERRFLGLSMRVYMEEECHREWGNGNILGDFHINCSVWLYGVDTCKVMKG